MRLFVAFELGSAVLGEVERLVTRLRPVAPEARWARTEAMHVTLAFLGEVEEARLPELESTLRTVAARHRPLSVNVYGGGTFGSRARPHVLWLGLQGDVEALFALRADLEAALTQLGFPLEARAFQPHLTLARARSSRGDARLESCRAQLEGASFGTVSLTELVLFESELAPKGAKHTPRCRARLSPAA